VTPAKPRPKRPAKPASPAPSTKPAKGPSKAAPSTAPVKPAAAEPGPGPGRADWLGVALIALCGALAAVIEALLVPLYIGSVVAPVAAVLALASNILLPRMARALVPSTLAAVAPFLTWLVVMIGFGVLTRPEGDVILPGAPAGAEYVTYVVLLGGALAGTVTIVLLTPPPVSKERAALNR
jgi:hypothetical protein